MTNNRTMKRIATVFLCACLTLSALAQNPTILAAARAELGKRGLDETEVRARLLVILLQAGGLPS